MIDYSSLACVVVNSIQQADVDLIEGFSSPPAIRIDECVPQ